MSGSVSLINGHIDRTRAELLQRAIHSAKCRIYRINYALNCNISLNHQRKAENQKELMDIAWVAEIFSPETEHAAYICVVICVILSEGR